MIFPIFFGCLGNYTYFCSQIMLQTKKESFMNKKNRSMTTLKQWVLAAILITSGASVFTGCTDSNGDNPVSENNLSEKIIGKWIVADLNGVPAPTNQKTVLTFVSPTKAEGVVADCYGTAWNEDLSADVRIEGNKVTIMSRDVEERDHLVYMTVNSIDDKNMYMDFDWRISADGEIVFHDVTQDRWERVTADYETDILCTWEGKRLNHESEFDDGKEHRWEFHDDGTYTFYNKVDGEWEATDDVVSEYILDGTLLCTRWKANGDGAKENREWWEIESVENGVMKWKALRLRDDGTTYTANYELAKVK